jgi:hypothetical protein
MAVPKKIEQNKKTALISQEKFLLASISAMNYGLALVQKSIDSLSSRNRIDMEASKLGLGIYEPATKIKGTK